MKILKKPVVAVILSLIIVLASTLVSVNTRLMKKTEAVNDKLISSYSYRGEEYSGIIPCIYRMGDIADNLGVIAKNYGISSDELNSSLSLLRSDIKRLPDIGAGTIYKDYTEFNAYLRELEMSLSDTGLSDRHSEAVNEYLDQLALLREEIADDAYNEIVAAFLKRFDKFPAKNFASLLNITYPQLFQ